MDKDEQLAQAGELLLGARWAGLASVDRQGQPLASMVAFVVGEEIGGLLLHLSRLAAHTRNLMQNPPR